MTLSHHHAVRVLGATGYDASEIIASDTCRMMVHERGQEDWDSEFGRMPRLFEGHESIPGLTWPTMTWASGSAPTLATSGYTTVVLWHRGGLYGAVVS